MGEIRILGTAHVSQKSVEEVKAAVDAFQPDVIAVELDPARYLALKKQIAEPSVSKLLEAGNFNQLLIQWTLSYIQRRIGMDVGVEPGAEMKAAIEIAEQRNIRIGLIDREINITLMRFWRSMSLWEKIKMMYALSVSVIGVEGEELDIESFKDEDVITRALEEFRKFSPNGAKVLIDERDAYLAHQLIKLCSANERTLAVVGAGHVKGIEKHIADPDNIPLLTHITENVKTRPWGKILAAGVTILFVLLLLAIIFSGIGIDVLVAALVYWIVIHGALTALFTLIAKGHPLSAATGFCVSWLTALNPLVAAGWFSAIVEAKIRKPAPSDFYKIFEAETFSDMWNIPLFRVIIVAAMANIGSTLGTVFYFIGVFPVLGIDPSQLIIQGFGNMGKWITHAL